MAKLFGAVVGCALVGAGVWGWVWNIIKVFSVSELGTEFILRVVGIFLPIIGAIYGYF